ncbi:MAG TPA: lipopolysaccharide heptosyltransferase II [Kiritimatiellia bacterium]|nr:lipopolysaccharide heptosyltransferase II [Kiritimatiellia bacterium]
MISPNWIGDCIMAMPGLQWYRERHPHDSLSVVCRPSVRGIWDMHPAPDGVLEYPRTWQGTRTMAKRLRSLRFDKAYILPNSYRTAYLAWAGGIPFRAGYCGAPLRSLLLKPCLVKGDHCVARHQAWEVMGLMNRTTLPGSLPVPRLTVPAAAGIAAQAWLEGSARPRVGILPGAARGPSKRWPVQSFCAVAAKLRRERGASIVLAGGPGDVAACDEIADGVGEGCIRLAGRTTLDEWAAVLASCDVVICNDSGGMHLAAAVGTPVVAVFGMTDPEVTGPLGDRISIVQGEGARGRDIARRSEEAEKVLAAIPAERVYEEAMRWLNAPGSTP